MKAWRFVTRHSVWKTLRLRNFPTPPGTRAGCRPGPRLLAQLPRSRRRQRRLRPRSQAAAHPRSPMARAKSRGRRGCHPRQTGRPRRRHLHAALARWPARRCQSRHGPGRRDRRHARRTGLPRRRGPRPLPRHPQFEEAATLPCAARHGVECAVRFRRPATRAKPCSCRAPAASRFSPCSSPKWPGARVIATSLAATVKMERLRVMGADDVINYRTTPGVGQAGPRIDRRHGRGPHRRSRRRRNPPALDQSPCAAAAISR